LLFVSKSSLRLTQIPSRLVISEFLATSFCSKCSTLLKTERDG
jgi:hypothetical protein